MKKITFRQYKRVEESCEYSMEISEQDALKLNSEEITIEELTSKYDTEIVENSEWYGDEEDEVYELIEIEEV
jgi:hypothetical protein